MASSGPVFSEAQYSKVLETVEQGMVHAASAFIICPCVGMLP